MTTLAQGNLNLVLQNVVYALPPRELLLFSNLALQVDNDSAFGTATSVAALTTVNTAATFVRCAGGNALVRILV